MAGRGGVKPWLKWFPRDWRSESRLRMCSLSARGLWIELIGYMHEAEPYGHLLIDGKRPTLEEIACLVGRPVKEVEKAFGELVGKHVCECIDGTVISRRMVRDKAKFEQDVANGKGGGNPQLREADNGGVNPPDKAHIPEARSQNPERKYLGASRPPNDDFERFWKAYPGRGKSRNPKAPAAKKFQQLQASGVPIEAIIGGAQRYADAMRDTKKIGTEYVAQAVTWLNQSGWEDYPSPMQQAIAAFGYYARDGSAELAAWDKFYQETRRHDAPRDRDFGWRFPSQWPPGHEEKTNATGAQAQAAGASSGTAAA